MQSVDMVRNSLPRATLYLNCIVMCTHTHAYTSDTTAPRARMRGLVYTRSHGKAAKMGEASTGQTNRDAFLYAC